MQPSERAGASDSIPTSSGYLDRRWARMRREELDRQILFGFAMGGTTFVLGFVHGLLVSGVDGPLWRGLETGGLVAIAAAVLLPSVWTWPERVVRTVATALQKAVLYLLLAVVYVLLVCPVGCMLRWSRGTGPILAWNSVPPLNAEGWRKKTIETTGGRIAARGRQSPLRLGVSVLAFFLKRKQFWLVPALVLLLVLGLLVFLVQSSAIAPFLYPLF